MSTPTWLSAIVNAVVYDITAAGILFQEHADGFGLPPMHRFTQRGPQQHGETNRDFRLDPRIITLIAGFARDCDAEVYAARQRLLGIFKPSNIPIKLRWDLSNGAVRQIDTFYSGSLTLPLRSAAAGGIRSQNQSGQTPIGSAGGVYQRSAIELIAHDPTFYDPTLQTVTLANTSFGDGLSVPLPVPFDVGASVLSLSQALTYAGDWLSYPTIRLIGPLTSPVGTNVTTGEVLDFTGSSVPPGDFWDIDLSYGAKTVVDAAGANQLAALSDASDLATFHLAAASDASATLDNTITLTATGGTSVSTLRLQYYHRFIGF
jgi:hypothetical protein